MTTVLNNSGASIPLQTTAGVDFVFVLGVDGADGNPLDLTGYTVEARLDDGLVVHDLPATLSAPLGVLDSVTVTIGHALTSTLPSISNYSVKVISPTDVRSQLAYGTVTTDRCSPS